MLPRVASRTNSMEIPTPDLKFISISIMSTVIVNSNDVTTSVYIDWMKETKPLLSFPYSLIDLTKNVYSLPAVKEDTRWLSAPIAPTRHSQLPSKGSFQITMV